VLLLLAAAGLAPHDARAQTTVPTLDALRNASYPSEFTADGTAPLADGTYSEPAASGSASLVSVTLVDAAIGDDYAAVVLATSGGGSGTFYTLHLASIDAGGLSTGAGLLLGDRIELASIAVEGDGVRIALTTQGPTDPFCCPTQEETRVYGFTATGFQLLSTTPGPGTIAPAPGDTGTAGFVTRTRAGTGAIAISLLLAALVVGGGRFLTSRDR
jgi:hypothetical protein